MPGSVNGLRNFTLHWQLHMSGTRHSVDTASVNVDKHTYIVDIYLMCPAFTSHRPRPSPMAIKMRLAFDYFQYFYCPRKFNKRKTFELLVLPKKKKVDIWEGTIGISFVVCQNICLGEIFFFSCFCCFLTILRVQHAKCVEWRKAPKRRLHYKLTELWPKNTRRFSFRLGVPKMNLNGNSLNKLLAVTF